jgi:hypothetical protein
MRKVLLVLLLAVLSSLGVTAQKVNGIELEDIPSKYVKLITYEKSSKMFQPHIAFIDYGQIESFKGVEVGNVISESGEQIMLSSMAMLNLLESKGYVVVSHNVLGAGSPLTINQFLLENTNKY